MADHGAQSEGGDKTTLGALVGAGDHVVLMDRAIDQVCGMSVRGGDAGGGGRAREALALDEYQGVVRRAMAQGLKTGGIVDLLVGEHGLGKDQAVQAAAAFEKRQGQLRETMVDHSARISGSHLRDMDWKVKVVLASSQASVMRQPLVELALYLADANGSTSEQVLEMDRAEVDRLIASLSSVRDAMNRIPY